MNPERTDAMLKSANDAYVAVESLNHATVNAVIPAPVAYGLLGSLSRLQDAVGELVAQVATGLGRSLLAYDVYDDAREPGESIRLAEASLLRAAIHARSAAERASAAQAAIAWQGFRLDKEDEL